MTELICDICGTSYPDTAPKCPTCGYGRAFEVPAVPESTEHGEYEKVPGGRFSRKNVQKRLSEQAETEEQPSGEEPGEQNPVQEPARTPAEEPVAQEPDPEQLREYRRDVTLNLLLSAAIVAFLAAGGYLLVSYGIPFIQSLIG